VVKCRKLILDRKGMCCGGNLGTYTDQQPIG
jgi:hypothetical protein